ncbi:23S rRNA (adenine(2503)-C(2))-methyltransferase RlmN [Candidatus Uhrbacteria bacterium]|nr:23S rRNA (adenine(2503)-C(2))-methyltransferase RlmN [Candidatus Uhrbacteria bacterium]
MPETRTGALKRLFPDEPGFRQAQLEKAVFDDGPNGWNEVTTLPQPIRDRLGKEVPWLSYDEDSTVFMESGDGDSFKAALELGDGSCIETVLMANRRGQWTACLSTQVGCAMRCAFCATGKLGLKRSLTSDEIVDQLRFWRRFLLKRDRNERVSNIVLMGMGEPLANYDNVKTALNLILGNTDIGSTRITVSTVGIIPQLNRILDDPEWPPVRLAVSLHSADLKTRKELMPTTYDRFLDDLTEWGQRYRQKFGNRRHHVTFEYLLLKGLNDTPDHAAKLVALSQEIGQVKVNLIPYNATDSGFTGSDENRIEEFAAVLRQAGIDVTRRRSLGRDIAAACGQLAGPRKG